MSWIVQNKCLHTSQLLIKGKVQQLDATKTQTNSVEQRIPNEQELERISQSRPEDYLIESQIMGNQQYQSLFDYEEFKVLEAESNKLEMQIKTKWIQKQLKKQKKLSSSIKKKFLKPTKAKFIKKNLNDDVEAYLAQEAIRERMGKMNNDDSQQIIDGDAYSIKKALMQEEDINKYLSLRQIQKENPQNIQSDGQEKGPQSSNPKDRDKERMKRLSTNYPNHVASLIRTGLISNGNEQQFMQFKNQIQMLNNDKKVHGNKKNWSLHNLKSVISNPQRRQMVAITIEVKGRDNIMSLQFVKNPQNKDIYLKLNQQFLSVLRSDQELRNPKINGSF